jgi:hypothetical protein
MNQKEPLLRLTEDGQRLVGLKFLKGETSLTEEDLGEYLEPIPGEPTADLSRIDDAVDRIIDEYPEYHTEMDGELVEAVHSGLDISRRVAGDPGLWHWLAVARYPGFVRHRWEFNSEEAMREKFLGAGSDLYSNALHRLWWIAELTREGDDYSTTQTVFSNQTMVNKVFDRWFARYRPAVIALCDELADEPSWVIDETTNRFNHATTSIQLEALNEGDSRELVEDIIRDVKHNR